MILLIDTSKREAVVALIDGNAVSAKRTWQADETLGVKLLEAIDEVLKEASATKKDLTRIAVHAGPGHFMALRTGIVTAQTLAQTFVSELVSVSSDELVMLISEALDAKPTRTIKPQYDRI